MKDKESKESVGRTRDKRQCKRRGAWGAGGGSVNLRALDKKQMTRDKRVGESLGCWIHCVTRGQSRYPDVLLQERGTQQEMIPPIIHCKHHPAHHTNKEHMYKQKITKHSKHSRTDTQVHKFILSHIGSTHHIFWTTTIACYPKPSNDKITNLQSQDAAPANSALLSCARSDPTHFRLVFSQFCEANIVSSCRTVFKAWSVSSSNKHEKVLSFNSKNHVVRANRIMRNNSNCKSNCSRKG